MADLTLAPLLRRCSNEDLEPLVKLLTDPVTADLDDEEKYQKYYPDHSQYTEEIAHHLRRFGGNTLVNIPRGEGPSYEEIVQDVADKLGVEYEYDEPVEKTEKKVLREVVHRASESDEISLHEKEDLVKAFKEMGRKNRDFEAVLDIVIAIAIRLLLRGTLLRAILGPLAWALIVIDIAGPAYRVTIPGVCLVAYLRLKIQSREDFGGNE